MLRTQHARCLRQVRRALRKISSLGKHGVNASEVKATLLNAMLIDLLVFLYHPLYLLDPAFLVRHLLHASMTSSTPPLQRGSPDQGELMHQAEMLLATLRAPAKPEGLT